MTLNLFLFFDDKNLLVREDAERVQCKPEPLLGQKYLDPNATLSNAFPCVWRDPESGRYLLFYNGATAVGNRYLCAESYDGICFSPLQTPGKWESKTYENEFMPACGEFACVYVDECAPKSERLKLLNARVDKSQSRIVENLIYVSADGLSWKNTGKQWHNGGAEPGAFVFYNRTTGKHSIVARPDAGVRRVCLIETDDFSAVSDARLIMNPDSLDKPLAEHYGMPVFVYENYFIGFLWIYEPPAIAERKYWGGKINAELVYSYNGTAFFRTLRTPIFKNDLPITAGMLFPSSMYFAADGSLIVMASVSPHEHGEFKKPGGAILPYRLRKDGFISLKTGEKGRILMGAMLCQGDNLRINLKGEATCALYTDDSKANSTNLFCHSLVPLSGYGHENCKKFSGDDTAWTPVWDGGTFGDLKDKIVYLEIRARDAEIYSIRADMIPMMICDLRRYHAFGVIPDVTGLL